MSDTHSHPLTLKMWRDTMEFRSITTWPSPDMISQLYCRRVLCGIKVLACSCNA